MNNAMQFFMVVVLALALVAQAHEGHDHAPVSMKKATDIALASARDYTLKQPPFGLKKLDGSWRDLPESAAQIHENGRGFYIVSLANPQQNQTLYVRILLDGRVAGANFSGAFSSAPPSSNNASSLAP
ncbi:MAG TPA: DUF6488 family protein [Cellvibrio sp.]|nr:DUF6488 family protein [Cellvibrio sp.]